MDSVAGMSSRGTRMMTGREKAAVNTSFIPMQRGRKAEVDISVRLAGGQANAWSVCVCV